MIKGYNRRNKKAVAKKKNDWLNRSVIGAWIKFEDGVIHDGVIPVIRSPILWASSCCYEKLDISSCSTSL